MLERAEERYGHLQGVKFQLLDLMHDPLPVGSYDLILSTWAFEHLADPVHVAEKAWGRLKPGGRMILLFEDQAPSFLSRLVGWIYTGYLEAHLVPESEYRRFPGQVVLESHFSGPVGDLALLVLEKE
jgi:2-polyprenyl-3-methyl-5-hydroxy-6-metoxy-1,4-benzoquinol methylase